jgi:RimJ/RimL family protein N-acetyltransferase
LGRKFGGFGNDLLGGSKNRSSTATEAGSADIALSIQLLELKITPECRYVYCMNRPAVPEVGCIRLNPIASSKSVLLLAQRLFVGIVLRGIHSPGFYDFTRASSRSRRIRTGDSPDSVDARSTGMTISGMPFRPLAPEDLRALMEVQEEGALAGLSHIFPQDRYPFEREVILERWRRELVDPAIHTYVSTDDDGPVTGFAAIRRNEFLHFGTAVRLWGSGLATLFHDFVVGELGKTNSDPDKAFYWLRVFEENHRARRFYEKLGWVATDIRSRSAFGPRPYLLEYRLDR